MARELSDRRFEGTDIRPYRPGDEVRASSANAQAHLQELARAGNLAFDEVCTDPAVCDGWNDGQLISADGDAITRQLVYLVPKSPTTSHTTYRARVYAKSVAGGTVTFSAKNHIAGGGLAVPMAIANAAMGFTEVDLTLDTTPAPDEVEEIEVSLTDDVHMVSLTIQPKSIATVDGANRLLAAGELHSGVVGLDIDDWGGDEALSSDKVDDASAIIEHCRERLRPWMAIAAPLAPSGGFDGYLAQKAFRRLVWVPPNGVDVKVWAYVTGSGSAANLWIQAGPGDRDYIYRGRVGRALHKLEIPAAAAQGWRSVTIRCPAHRNGTAPGSLSGWTHFAVLPDGQAQVHSVCAWALEVA